MSSNFRYQSQRSASGLGRFSWLTKKRFLVPVVVVLLGMVMLSRAAIADSTLVDVFLEGLDINPVQEEQRAAEQRRDHETARFTEAQVRQSSLTRAALTGDYLTRARLYSPGSSESR